MAIREIKKRKISEKDIADVEEKIRKELESRRNAPTRARHEKIWKSVDAQIAMVPPGTVNKTEDPDEDWHSAIQLGAVADALEIISADVLRISLPQGRRWFDPHSELPLELDPETGDELHDPLRQSIADGILRSFMTQQHMDFGFRDRVKAAIKEALSHGSVAVTPRMLSINKIHSGSDIEVLAAPAWVNHSMWNTYLDPRHQAQSIDMFYAGSLIILDYMPWDDFTAIEGFSRMEKVQRKKNNKKDSKGDTLKTDEVELIYYYGDLFVERSGSDEGIAIRNRTTILANGTLVFSEVNQTPHNPCMVIGYEKDDLRDPYYSSPLIKRSPAHMLQTELANRFIDNVEVWGNPPIVYDGYDATLVENGGPDLSPGARTAMKGTAQFKELKVGDPSAVLDGWKFISQEVERGTSVDSIRSGVSEGTEQTATEIIKKDQKGEIRTIDFVGTFERTGLRPFLYMQHYINRKHLKNYPFFNNEIHTPDFLRWSKSDLVKTVHFDITGSRDVLGEEQRTGRFAAAVQFASSNPFVAQRTNWDTVASAIWEISGEKNPERFVLNTDEEPIAQIVEQFEQQIQEMQTALQEFQFADEKHALEVEQLQTDLNFAKETISLMEEKEQGVRALQSKLDSIRAETQRLEVRNAKQTTPGNVTRQ